jgi:hypothetical protein
MSTKQRLTNRVNQARQRIGLRAISDPRWYDETHALLAHWEKHAKDDPDPENHMYLALDLAAHVFLWAEEADRL